MKHDNSTWTEDYPFINGTLCDSDGNEIRSWMTEKLLRCADTKPTKPGDYNVIVENCFSFAPLYKTFDGNNWDISPDCRSVWWHGGEPDGPMHTLSEGKDEGEDEAPPTLLDRLKLYKDRKQAP
jgi:hypothetical protein